MQTQPVTRRLVDISNNIESPFAKRLYSLVGTPFEKLLSLHTLNQLYAQTDPNGSQNFFAASLQALEISYDVSASDVARIPTTGPVIVVANHPFGAVEGLILGDLLTQTRTDVRVLANYLLTQIREVQPWLIAVDPFGGQDSTYANLAPIKAAFRWLKNGGLLATFPAGTVSHLHMRKRAVVDPEWSTSAAALAKRTGATVVPVFFEGRNSAWFQLAGLLHPRLRTALIPSELLRRSQSAVGLRVGKPISADKLRSFGSDEEATKYLRFKTYALASRDNAVRPRFKAVTPVVPPAAIGNPVNVEVLKAEVARLPQEANLLQQGPYAVYLARQAQIPAVLKEIGHLREKTFRAVGEGTGKSEDLDEFDKHYLHLFMWNSDTSEVVGSYRLGVADEILERQGLQGLYTSTLFKFKPGFLDRLNPAIELGRSFIRQEYQRKPLSLALLWRGIGEFLVRNPQYKVLFGPVSISGSYESTSRRWMVEFLNQAACGDDELKALVKPKNPPKDRLAKDERKELHSVARDVEELSSLIADIEEDDKGVPVLLKHYLKLNARLCGFNVDPLFNDCLDGLIVVDLRTTAPKVLKRFMGEAGHAFYSSVA
ncbi:MAG: lysophospholipid acyltransferase family protein [Deltaproteobacteria bacterium]|nr:lysophospholipid acyltransferase family protein [Deltaproteobacteria bacterium]